MDKKTFTDRIYRYIQTTDIDYAIALNGAWGIGKTHFVKSTFIGKNDDWKGIYVSLADKTTPDDAVSWIIQAIIGNLGTAAGKNLKALCEFATQTTDQTTKFIGHALSKVIDIGQQKLTQEWLKEKSSGMVLFLDDLERFKGNTHDLLARIHDRFIDIGIHVIYITNEEMIPVSSKYEKIKEKYIRYTYAFDRVFSDTLYDIISCKPECKYTGKLSQATGNMYAIAEWMQMTGIRNLRTFQSAMDCYEYLNGLCEIPAEEKFGPYLFITIMAHVDYINTRRKDETGKQKDFIEHAESRNLKVDSMYGARFLSSSRGMAGIKEFPFILEFIQNGYISDTDSAISQLQKEFSYGNEYERAYFNINPDLEDAEMKATIDKVLEGILKRKLGYGRLLDVAEFISYIERIEGPTNIRSDYKEIIRKAVLDDTYPDKQQCLDDKFRFDLRKNELSEEPFAKEVMHLMEQEQPRFEKAKDKQQLIAYLEQANDRSFAIKLPYDAQTLFSKIVEYELWDELTSLNKWGIHQLVDKNLSKDDEFSDEGKHALQVIRDKLQGYIDSANDIPETRVKRFQRTIVLLDNKITGK